MSYTYDRDKMPTIHPDLGKFDFVVAKDKREWAQCKGIGGKEWIEFANLMFEQFPFIYNTCLLMNDEQKANAETIRQQKAEIDRLTGQRDRLLKALGDLSFECFGGGVGTCQPSIKTYNETFAVLDEIRKGIA